MSVVASCGNGSLHYWKVSHSLLPRIYWKRHTNGFVIRKRIGVFSFYTHHTGRGPGRRAPRAQLRTTGRHPDRMSDVVNGCGPLFCPWSHALPYGPFASAL